MAVLWQKIFSLQTGKRMINDKLILNFELSATYIKRFFSYKVLHSLVRGINDLELDLRVLSVFSMNVLFFSSHFSKLFFKIITRNVNGFFIFVHLPMIKHVTLVIVHSVLLLAKICWAYRFCYWGDDNVFVQR